MDLAPGRPTLAKARLVFWSFILTDAISTILTISLIFYMRRNRAIRLNAYLKCVLLMSGFQIVVNSSMMMQTWIGTSSPYPTGCVFYVLCLVMGGMGASLWALMIIVGALFVAELGRKPTKREEMFVFVCVTIFVIAWGIPYGIAGYTAGVDKLMWAQYLNTYNYCRIFIIVVTFLLLIRLYVIVRRVTTTQHMKQSPLYHLTRRLFLYPIIQAVSRLGATPYSLLYKGGPDGFPEGAGHTQTAFLFCYVIFTPIAGIGGFLVFLNMQEGAMHYLKRMLRCDTTIATTRERKENASSSQRDLANLPTLSEASLQLDNDDESGSRKGSQFNLHANYIHDVNYAFEGHHMSTEEDDCNRFSVMGESELVQEYLQDHSGRLTTSKSNPRVKSNKVADAIPEGTGDGIGMVRVSRRQEKGGTSSNNPLHAQEPAL